MGVNEEALEKRYVIISGLNFRDNNRGTAALSYGSLHFCLQNGYIKEGQELVNFFYVKKFWKKKYKYHTETYTADGHEITRHMVYVTKLEKSLYDKFHILLPFTKFGRCLRNTSLVAAINGGDGFSDIYNDRSFHGRLYDTNIAMLENIPLVILPQTLGPFEKKENYETAKKILQYAKAVYVRDDKYTKELDSMSVKYSLTQDLSYFMQPEPWDINIVPGSIGINISGLCYSNKFRTLSGQFEQYPELINQLIEHFQQLGKTVYLIPHSYNYRHPEANNDDMDACRCAYDKLKDKTNVVFVDKDLTSPQVKYVISKMSFFCGTRMHANFAAIYTGVPVFALAYSYKFEGAFNQNGLDGAKQTCMINNISAEDISGIIEKINRFYTATL